ncbi:transcription elongation factor GreA, partial [Arthrobacter deserti]|nr:transcription elongation factor GreA [Arthrobacter deserti]
RQLTELLRNAHVGEAPANDGVVEPGMVIEAKIAGDPETFLLGSREVAGDAAIDVYSEKSPLGAAIHGLKAGDSTTYTAPNGKQITVEIISAKPYAG